MNKHIRLIALILSFSLFIAGCKGKTASIVENDTPEQEVNGNEISDNDDGEIKYDKDLKYHVNIETNVKETSSDNIKNSEDEIIINSNKDDGSVEKDPNIIATYKNFDYENVDTKGLSKETLDLFAPCAIYLKNGGTTANGDLLSSKNYLDIKDFLYDFIYVAGAELMHDIDGNQTIPTEQRRMKYEDWDYLLREVLIENDPEIVRNKLPNKFDGEDCVFYNSNDNYIYIEKGAGGWEDGASVREVKREGDAYIITYDLYWGGYSLTGVSEVTIADADNKYGYSLVSVDYIKSFYDRDY